MVADIIEAKSIEVEIEPTDRQILQVVKEFGVETEEELSKKLSSDDWCITICPRCKKKVSLTNCSFDENHTATHKPGKCGVSYVG